MTKETIHSALTAHRRQTYSVDHYPDFKSAAVLLLLFPKDHILSILLTIRTHLVETHKGQISCPGGMTDACDDDAIDTALRETEEELSIPRTEIAILGLLDDHITPTGFIITPVVGYMDHPPACKPNDDEVASVIEAPIALFRDREAVRREERIILGSLPKTVWYFPYGEHTIWGATASMIVNLLDIVAQPKYKNTDPLSTQETS